MTQPFCQVMTGEERDENDKMPIHMQEKKARN